MTWKDWFELVRDILIVIGIPVSVYKFWEAKAREREEAEYRVYDAVDNKYVQFQSLAFQNPRLDIGPLPDAEAVTLADMEQKQELALTILASLFERVFLMYREQRSAFKRAQWMGWEKYIADYCGRANFKKV